MIQKEFNKLKVNMEYYLDKDYKFNILRSFISKYYGEIDIKDEELLRFE